MADRFQGHSGGMSGPAEIHVAITPNDGADLPFRPRAIVALTAGNVSLVDSAGTAITYPVTAGQVLPFRAMRVRATGTTATVVGWE